MNITHSLFIYKTFIKLLRMYNYQVKSTEDE